MNEIHVSIKKNKISDAVTENYVSIRNLSSISLAVPTPSSLDEQFALFPDLSQTRIHYWSSLWGSEWQPSIVPATVEVSLQVTSGRSSNGYHPFVIIEDGIRAMVVAIAWSGNWQLKIDSQGNSLSIKAGLHSKEQRQLVGPLEEISLPIVYVSQELISGTSGACRYLIEAFRSKTGNGTVPKLLMEWNSWWPYEDIGMNREVLLANAKIAAEVGLEIAILDAGWFGSSELDSNWFEQRGDWTFINEARFPGGLEEIASEIRSLGVEFGIWIEIEGLGKNASVLKEQPNFMAQRRDDGNEIRDLGYLCLGNAYAQVWALNQLISLVKRLEARWIKVDFNADPEFGCNRVDHGHSAVDGLFAHVTGLYDVLDKFRKECPEVVLESCSSGGLRWDLGIASHVDIGFGSDTDWPEHALCVFWSSSQFFPVEKLLGWCDSQWNGDNPNQTFKIHDIDDLSYLEFIFSVNLLGGFGISQKLPDFSTDQRAILKKYCNIYRDEIRPRYQSAAQILRLTEQPQRGLGGARTVAFAIESDQYSTVILIFNLPGASPDVSIIYKPQEYCERYLIRELGGDHEQFVAPINDEILLTFQMPVNSAKILLVEESPTHV